MPPMVISDLDDFLMPYSSRYYRANDRCALLIAARLGMPPTSVERIATYQQELDKRRTVTHGFHTSRFTESWLIAYEHLRSWAGVPVDERLLRNIRRITTEIHNPPFALYSGAIELLQFSRRAGHRLSLVTAGDAKQQIRKLNWLGIYDAFDHHWFEEQGSKRAGLTELKHRANGDRCIVMGDGLGSEIRHGAELGMDAIWLNNPSTWSVFHGELDAKFYHTAHSLWQVRLLLDRLTRSAA